MIERTPVLNFFTHIAMLIGLVMAALPIYIVFVASSHDFRTVNLVPMPLTPGSHLIEKLHDRLDQVRLRHEVRQFLHRRHRRDGRKDRARGDLGLLDRLLQLPAADGLLLADLRHPHACRSR